MNKELKLLLKNDMTGKSKEEIEKYLDTVNGYLSNEKWVIDLNKCETFAHTYIVYYTDATYSTKKTIKAKEYANGRLYKGTIARTKTLYEAIIKTQKKVENILKKYTHVYVRVFPEYTLSDMGWSVYMRIAFRK